MVNKIANIFHRSGSQIHRGPANRFQDTFSLSGLSQRNVRESFKVCECSEYPSLHFRKITIRAHNRVLPVICTAQQQNGVD